MAPRWSSKVHAPVVITGHLAGRTATVSAPSQEAAEILLNNNVALCSAFVHLKREGEELAVGKKGADTVIFTAKRPSTGDPWSEALESKLAAARQENQDTLAALASKVSDLEAEFSCRLDKETESFRNELQAQRTDTENLQREFEKLQLRYDTFGLSGQAITLRLFLDLVAGVSKEAAYGQWASKEKVLSKGLRQMFPAGVEQASTKKSSKSDPFEKWLKELNGPIILHLPNIGKRSISLQGIQSISVAPSLSTDISGAGTPEGAHSATLLAIAHVLSDPETALHFPLVAANLPGLRSLFQSFFGRTPGMVVAEHLSGADRSAAYRVVHLDEYIRQAKATPIPVRAADQLAALALLSGNVISITPPGTLTPSAVDKVEVSFGGARSTLCAVPTSKNPLHHGDVVLVATGTGSKKIASELGKSWTSDGVIFGSVVNNQVEKLDLGGLSIGEQLVLPVPHGQEEGVSCATVYDWKALSTKVVNDSELLCFEESGQAAESTTEQSTLRRVVVTKGGLQPVRLPIDASPVPLVLAALPKS